MTRFTSLGVLRRAWKIAALFIGCVTLNANAAQAQIWTEEFGASFASWESAWLGQYSNLQNYYVVYGSDISYRGNNPGGLYLSDGLANGTDAYILFDPAFGGPLTSISFDLVSYSNTTLTIFDTSGATLFSALVTPFGDAFNDPGIYANFGAISTNGIGGFSLVGGQAEGNISLDNVVVQRIISGIPEPSTWVMMLLGFGAVGCATRRRRKAVRVSPAIA